MGAAKCLDYKKLGNIFGRVEFEAVDSYNNKQAVLISRIFPILVSEEVNILDFNAVEISTDLSMYQHQHVIMFVVAKNQ